MKELYRLENLSKEYQNERQSKIRALDSLTVTIETEETTALVGESGSGKSTLGMILAGLELQTQGNLFYRGKDIRKEIGLRAYRREVQMIFQNPFDALDPGWKIRDSLTEPVRSRRIVPRAQEESYIRAQLECCGLKEDVLEKRPSQLSGGQLQRIAIARILALRPKVLIADEIVTALDASVQSRILELLMDIRRSYPFSLIFISHDLAVVRKIADRILVMKEGKIIEDGRSEDIFTSPRNEYTKALIKAIPGWGV